MRHNHDFKHLIKPGILTLILVLLGLMISTTSTVKAQGSGQVEIIYFWGDGCPHCAEAKPFLDRLEDDYPNVKITRYEVWYNAANQVLYKNKADALKVPEGGRGVPFIVIGDRYWMGYSPQIAEQIEAVVKEQAAQLPAGETPALDSGDTLTLPLIGKIDLGHQSLFVSTLLISFVDGVNPCSIWVLTMLLAMTLHTGSRKKIIIIGLIFLTVTAGIYALFIAGLFTFLSIVSFIGWIQVVVALIALLFGLVNIKDYFWYKEGISFTIDDSKKPGIFQRMRRLVDASQSFWGLAGATALMAAGVSLVEFSCTAGFPVLWTNLLVSQNVTPLVFVLLLLVYMVIYQLDEMVIFFTAVYSLKATRLEEKQGRILKLIGGVLMLVLAAVMLINPQMMSSLSSALVIFAIAFALVVLVLVLHRRVLPAYGIWIGTEAGGRKKAQHRKATRSRR